MPRASGRRAGRENIRTLISEHGIIINAGYQVDYRDRQTRKVRWELADQDIPYVFDDLERRMVAPDQILPVKAACTH